MKEDENFLRGLWPLVVLLLLLIGYGWFSQTRPLVEKRGIGQEAAMKTEVKSDEESKNEASQKASPPQVKGTGLISRKGSWQLKEGETGMFTYLSEVPGKHGLVLVKLKKDEAGNPTLTFENYKIDDEAVPQKGLEKFMPELLQTEKFEKLTRDDLAHVTQALEGSGPTFTGRGWSRDGRPSSSSSTVSTANGEVLRLERFSLLQHPTETPGLYEVELEYVSELGALAMKRHEEGDD